MGHADQGRELPACRGTAESRAFFSSCWGGACRQERHDGDVRCAGEGEADDQEALRQVTAFYHETLNGVAGSGAASGVARTHTSGTGRALSTRLRESHAGLPAAGQEPERRREIRGRPRTLGIIREAGSASLGSLVFPILSLEGAVLGDVGAQDHGGLAGRTPLHTYLPGPHRGVWNEEALQASKEIILRESIIDALTFRCAVRNLTASYGGNGSTEDHNHRVCNRSALSGDTKGTQSADQGRLETGLQTREKTVFGANENRRCKWFRFYRLRA